MVLGPTYIKLIVNNAPKRDAANKTSSPGPGARPSNNETGRLGPLGDPDLVRLLTRENQAGSASRIPTPEEAQEALSRLQKDLPSLGEGVNDLHSNLDRSRILSLLAPLVEP